LSVAEVRLNEVAVSEIALASVVSKKAIVVGIASLAPSGASGSGASAVPSIRPRPIKGAKM
jgi:hypothetical protein